ncbi:MAG TPA: glycosyltransferase family 4 protein [Candidatus Nanoarchaeia archaeon]|nr:glycosyltransferase family 4 protein [Candidatus Nanoarchaeia archaeon]
MRQYLLFTLEFPPQTGGVATLYKNLADNWPADNLTVLADAASGSADSGRVRYRRLIAQKIRPRWLPALWHLWQTIRELKKVSLVSGNKKNSEVEIIVGQILPLGLVAYYLAKFIPIKYTVLLHGLDFSLASAKGKIKRAEKILRRADKIICSNSFTANSVKIFDAALTAKIFLVNPGIEPVFIRNPQRVRELRQQFGLADKLVLLSLGRLVPRKGFDRAIAALAAISQAVPEIIYAIAGSGPEADNLKNAAGRLEPSLRNKIIFLGKISEADRWAWLELCDIFIMPARNINGDYEGFGQVYLEANLAGKPVVAGDSGGVRDAVINGINGLLVNSENTIEIAQAVISLAQDPESRRSLGEAGKRRVVENFSAKKMAEKFYQLFL